MAKVFLSKSRGKEKSSSSQESECLHDDTNVVYVKEWYSIGWFGQMNEMKVYNMENPCTALVEKGKDD